MHEQVVESITEKQEGGEPVNWVGNRLDCGEGSISLSLMERVKQDVDRVNVLRGPDTRIVVKGNMRRYFVEFETNPQNHPVCFVTDGERGVITFARSGETEQRVVTWKWNPETAKCRLYLDGEPSELWRISQAALYNLFFPKG